MRKVCFLFLFIVTLNSEAQHGSGTSEKFTNKGLLLGAQVAKYPALEIGFHSTKFSEFSFWGWSASLENNFLKEYRCAPKLRVYVDALFVEVGVSVPWYFDLKGNNSLRLRPEIGFSNGGLSVLYTPNIVLTNKNMDFISKSILTISYSFHINKPVKSALPHSEV